jgi:hypothetical protein
VAATKSVAANSKKWHNCCKNQQKNLENGQNFSIFALPNLKNLVT